MLIMVKTTLVDGLLQQSGTFSEHQVLEERVMDSGDLEKEKRHNYYIKKYGNSLQQYKNKYSRYTWSR